MKLRVLYLFAFCGLNFYTEAQEIEFINNNDTFNILRSKCLNYVALNFDLIKLENFKDIIKHKENTITYSNNNNVGGFTGMKNDPILRILLKEKIEEYKVNSNKGAARNIKFKYLATRDVKFSYCHFVIYPVVKLNDLLIMKIWARSIKYLDDVSIGEMYFFYDCKLNLQYFYYTDSVL